MLLVAVITVDPLSTTKLDCFVKTIGNLSNPPVELRPNIVLFALIFEQLNHALIVKLAPTTGNVLPVITDTYELPSKLRHVVLYGPISLGIINDDPDIVPFNPDPLTS